jgi:glycolate oxidase iron-sulfur subunit
MSAHPLPIVPADPSRTPALSLDPRTYARGISCVHCGLCLPACPTYTENGLEADSPRGRIVLMLGLHEGRIEPTPQVLNHLDRCLDCRACESACPSGVVYHELIEEARSKLPPVPRGLGGRLVRWTFLHVLTQPGRLKLALLPARLLQRVGLYKLLRRSGLFGVLPVGLRKMESMLPPTGPLWPARLKVAGPVRVGPRVVFFQGCVGQVMFADVNQQAVDLLSAAGAAVSVSRNETCCGAIHHHSGGGHGAAEAMARRNIDAFESAVPETDRSKAFIVSTVAGCGAMLRDYATLLRDDADYAERAKLFAARVRDVTEVLAELGLPAMRHRVELTATYHDACHLVHAQKVSAEPRALLAQVPGLTLVPLPESDMCCGAAGTYNLEHPQMAGSLATRKLGHIAGTGAAVCVTGNVGCAMHLAGSAREAGRPLTVLHPVEVLHRAVFGD